MNIKKEFIKKTIPSFIVISILLTTRVFAANFLMNQMVKRTELIMILTVFISILLVLTYFILSKKRVSEELEKSINYFTLFIFLQAINWGLHLIKDLGYGGGDIYEHFFSTLSIIPLLLAIWKIKQKKLNKNDIKI